MNQKHFLFLILLINGLRLFAQVGINNPNPSATLDVIGLVLVQENVYLENPGNYSDNSTKLLVINDGGEVNRYVSSSSLYGPINSVQFVFKNTSDYGLDGGYNTKISTEKYSLVVHSSCFLRTGTTNTGVSYRSIGSNKRSEGTQFYAYKSGGTWWIKGFVNNSRSYNGSSLTSVDLYMDVLIYRNNFITKTHGSQTVNMAGGSTKIATLPPGF